MSTTNGKFNGATLINLNVAQSNVSRIIQKTIEEARLNINPVELYVLNTLAEQDGAQASVLARSVGRAATSFTPNLDKLQKIGLIERQADKNGDRRAVNIHLTKQGRDCTGIIRNTLTIAEGRIRAAAGVTEAEWQTYQKVLSALQSIE